LKIAIEARPIQWSYGTGIGNYTHSLISKLSEIDRENQYTFLWTDDTSTELIPFDREYSHYALPREDLREEVEIPRWLRQERADVFHLPQNGFRTPQPGPYQIIVTIHDLIPYFYPEMVRTSFLKRFAAEMPFIVERAAHIITVSAASKNDLLTVFGIDSAKISVIPSGPSSAYRPLPREDTALWLRKNYRLDFRYILYVGGLNPRKNVSELVYAFSKIVRDLPNQQRLVILGGEGKHLAKLKGLAEALNIQADVIFPGFVKTEHLPFFYNGADLFVYPSLYEGFGLPPIEAMACGTPVITSNVSSLPEVAGEAALTVNPWDTMALGEAILRVLSDPLLSEAMIKKGLQQCQRYNWTAIATQVLQVYRMVQQS
jgi:glycosyltransferase involved in cell wall biosynthesis